MKTILYILSILLLTSCATSSFQQRKHLSGKFKAPKASLSSLQIKKEKDEIINSNSKVKHSNLSLETTHSSSAVNKVYPYEHNSTDEITVVPKEKNEEKSLVLGFTQKEDYQAEFIDEPIFDDTVFVNGNSVEGELARKSKNQGTASLILGILSFFPFPLTTLIFSIVGIALAKSALRSRYQSEVGRTNARIGKVLSIISLSLLIAAILLVITALFLFGF